MSRSLVAVVMLFCATALSAQVNDPLIRHPATADKATDGATKVAQKQAEILDAYAAGGDAKAAEAAALELFDRVIAQERPSTVAPFTTAALTLRTVRQTASLDTTVRGELLPFLRQNPDLWATLVFLVKPVEDPRAIYALLNRFRVERSDHNLNDYANLVAAICVVHDQKLTHRINENRVEAADPLLIYDFYQQNEKEMLFGVRKVPAELLVYVVDNAVSLDEMRWALRGYANNNKVGSLFFTIEYDFAHFLNGQPKKVTQAGFNLPNIQRHGGVCADQAYFAVAVGKSIGVPTAYTVGASGEMGHAWVGFLEQRGPRKVVWNSDIGRYPAYQGVRGWLMDPQTRQRIPDSHVAVLGEMIGSGAADRHASMALADAAARVADLEDRGVGLAVDAQATPSAKVSVALAEDLLEAALKNNAGNTVAWGNLRDLAEAGKLSLTQKKLWAARVEQICGRDYPDFSIDVLAAMVRTVENVNEQSALWDSLFKMYPRRHDLCAYAKTEQGKMWEAAGDATKAGKCYEEVVTRFADAGPFVIDALERTERMLVDTGRGERVLTLYQQTWERLPAPRKTAGVDQSNWAKIGRLYADRLTAAGKESDAARVKERLASVLN